MAQTSETSERNLPLIGAALTAPDLPAWRDWLIGEERDVEVQDFMDPNLLSGDWQTAAAQILSLLDGHRGRRGIHGPFLGFSLAGGDEEIDGIARQRLERALELAECLCADQIVIHSPFTRWVQAKHLAGISSHDTIADRVYSLIAPALARASDQGVEFVLENIEDADPEARALVVDAAQAAGHRSLALSVDTGHAAVCHGIFGAPPAEEFVTAAGTRLHHVHLADNDFQADLHLAPGAGRINWQTVFAAFEAMPAPPRLLLEMRDASWIRPAMKFLTASRLGR